MSKTHLSSHQHNLAKWNLWNLLSTAECISSFPTHAKTFTCKQKSGTTAKLETFKKSVQVTEDLDLIRHHFHIGEVIYVDSWVTSKIKKRFCRGHSKVKQQPVLQSRTLFCVVFISGNLQSNPSARILPLPKGYNMVIVTRGESFPSSCSDQVLPSPILQDAIQLRGHY